MATPSTVLPNLVSGDDIYLCSLFWHISFLIWMVKREKGVSIPILGRAVHFATYAFERQTIEDKLSSEVYSALVFACLWVL